jgi:DNA-binding MarR family transcriptional regulator
MTPTTSATTDRAPAAPVARVSAGLERSLTQVGRAILRLDVPGDALPDGVTINRTGHWLLVRVSETAPVRLSEIADSVELDLSTLSRQVRYLVDAGLLAKVPDPADGRAALLSLTEQGAAVLESVSEARRRVLAEAIADWTDEERTALASGLLRLGAGLHHARDTDARDR